jgi:hypothetical protein
VKVKFHVAPKLNAEMLHAMVDQHPRMQQFRQNMARRLDGGESYAHALGSHILRRVVGDVADVHINAVVERLGRIEKLREKIDTAIDSVLDGHGLPKEFNGETMQSHFADLKKEMNELTLPRDALIGDGPLKITDSVPDYSSSLLSEFDTQQGSAREHGQFGEPIAAMKKRFNELPDSQRGLLRQARDVAPDDLEAAITGNDVQQQAALQRLREKLSGMSDADFKSVTDGIQDLGRARTKGLLVDPIELHGRLEKIGDSRLRAVIASGDPWIVQSLAIMSPSQLEGLWQAHIRKGGDARGFSGYVRGEMVHYSRSVFGEHTAAFAVPEMDYFLKGPDFRVRDRGTDLVGIGKDQWTWILEDKSHLAPSASSATAIFENLVSNLEKDARDFRARERKLKSEVPKYETPPLVDDSIQHMQAAANDLRSHLNALPEAQRFSPDSLARMRGILDQHRIKLRITSGFGEVTQISQDLARLGIRVKSTGPDIKISH